MSDNFINIRELYAAVIRLTVAIFLAVVTSACAAPHFSTEAARTNIIPESMGGLRQKFGASPVVKVGNLVWISGITGHMLAPDATVESMIEGVYLSIQEHLASAGATMEDVVEVETFTTDKFQHFATYHKVHSKFFKHNPPAWSAFGVETLVDARLVLEVKVMAVIGSGSNVTEVWPDGESISSEYPNYPSPAQIYSKYQQDLEAK